MSAITAKASRKMKKYAVLTREPRCFLGSFDFSWEQRKLGDIASDIVAGGDIDKDLILAEGQYPVIANALTGDGIVGYYDKEYRVNAPAVTVTGRGDVGHAKTRLVNFTPVVRLLSVKSEHDVFFLENAINTLKIVIESTGVPQLTVPQLAKYEVAFPRQHDEEKHIGAFFKQLDHLITLHQRKCANLCSPSQVVFSLLFATSTFSWEQRKVGDLLIERNQQAPMSDEYPLMAFIANEGVAPKGERYDRSALVTDTVNKLYKKTEKGDFIYSSNNLETGSIGLNKYGKACISPVYSIFEPTGIADSDFLGRRLVRKDFINAMVKWRQGVIYGQWRIHESDFLKIEITVPSVEEQRKIGTYLDQLDHLITLHQRKPFLMKWRTSDANRNQTNRLVL